MYNIGSIFILGSYLTWNKADIGLISCFFLDAVKNSWPFIFTYLFVHLNRITPISLNKFSIYYLKSLLLAYHNRISSVGIARPEWVTTTAAATLATTTTTSCRPDRVKVDRNWCKQISGLTKTRPERCAILLNTNSQVYTPVKLFIKKYWDFQNLLY